MEAIDQGPFNLIPTVGLAVGVMVGFLVFAVALDLTWAQFHRVLRRPKAILSSCAPTVVAGLVRHPSQLPPPA